MTGKCLPDGAVFARVPRGSEEILKNTEFLAKNKESYEKWFTFPWFCDKIINNYVYFYRLRSSPEILVLELIL